MHILGRFFRVGFLALAVLTSIASSASAAPRHPLPPWPEIYLYQWSFDEPYTTPALLAPVASRTAKNTWEAPAWVESWSGYALNRQGAQIQPTQLALNAGNGFPTVAKETGTLRFWFCPQWASGQGPGTEARLLEFATGTGKGSVPWWGLSVSPDGTALSLVVQSGKGLVEEAKANIQWQAGQWHLVALAYTPSNTVLSVDAQTVAVGPGLPAIPENAWAVSGLVLGSDALGQNAAQGQFEELTSFPYPYPDLLLGFYYRGYRRQANLGPVQALATEREKILRTEAARSLALKVTGGDSAQALDLEPPGGGSGDTNAVVPVYPLATNGLRLVVTSLTNNAMTVTILGGTNNAVYDFFATTQLVGDGGTNCTWTWQGQGQNSNTYSLTVQTNLQTVFLLGSPQDTDGDGITDAYEKLVSHTNPSASDSDGDGVSDAQEIAWGSKPNLNSISTNHIAGFLMFTPLK